MVRHLFQPDILNKRLETLAALYPDVKIDKDHVMSELPVCPKNKPFVRDTIYEMSSLQQQKKNFLEGAQGGLLGC